MGRPHRQTAKDSWQHAYGRGIRRTAIFRDTADRLKYLELADSAFERRQLKVFSYCLLDNHYHFGLHDPDGQISKAMQQLGRNYTRYFNDRYDFDGPLCKSRFGSRLLGDDRDLIGVSRYIHRNALDVHPNAPMEDYRWSSFGTYLGHRATDLTCLITDPVLTLAGGPDTYQRLVEHEGPLIDATSQRPLVVVAEIEREVRRVFGTSEPDDLGRPGKGRKNDARRCVAALIVDVLRLTPAEICGRYGFRDHTECAVAIERYRLRMERDPELASRHERVITALLHLANPRAS